MISFFSALSWETLQDTRDAHLPPLSSFPVVSLVLALDHLCQHDNKLVLSSACTAFVILQKNTKINIHTSLHPTGEALTLTRPSSWQVQPLAWSQTLCTLNFPGVQSEKYCHLNLRAVRRQR